MSATCRRTGRRRDASCTSLPGLASRGELLATLARDLRRGIPVAVLHVGLERLDFLRAALGEHGLEGMRLEAARRIRRLARRWRAGARVGGFALAEAGLEGFFLLLEGVSVAALELATLATGLRDDLLISACQRRAMTAIAASIGAVDAAAAADVAAEIAAMGPRGSGRAPGELLRRAAAALLSAREAGCGSVRLYEPGLLEPIHAALESEGRLREAIARDQLELRLRPVLRPGDGRRLGWLAQPWQAARGTAAPFAVEAAAFAASEILPLGRWTLRRLEAGARLGQLSRLAQRGEWLALRLGAGDVVQGGLLEALERLVAAAPSALPRLRVDLETGSLASEGSGRELLGLIGALQARGLALAFEGRDGGLPQAETVRRLRHAAPGPAVLKVGPACIDGVSDGAIARALADGALRLARALGCEAAAFGVTRLEDLAGLRSLGFDQASGAAAGSPRPLDEAIGERTSGAAFGERQTVTLELTPMT